MRWLGWILAGLGLVAFGVIGWSWRAEQAEERFEDEVDRLRSQGALVDPDRLAAPPIPDDENAAVPLLDAWAQYEASEDEWPVSEVHRLRKAIDGGAALPEDEIAEHWTAVEAWIDGSGRLLATLRRAAARPACRFEPKWPDASTPALEPLSFLWQASTQLEWTVRVGIRRGVPPSRLIPDCAAAWRILTFVPPWTPMNCIFRWHQELRLVRSIERLARRGAAAGVRARFEPLFAAEEDPATWIGAMETERIALIANVRTLARWTGADGLERLTDPGRALEHRLPGRWKRVFTRPQLFRDGLRALERHARAVAWVRDDLRTALPKLRGADYAAAQGGPYRGFFRARENGMVTLVQNRLLFLARLRLTRIGLALLAFHEETARWPASLAELAPMFPGGVPRDPGSDNAFAYEPGVRIGPAGSGIQGVAFELQ